MRTLLAAVLLVATTAFGPSAAATAAELQAADDSLPGIVLETATDSSATVTGTLDAGAGDVFDIYSVYLAEGEQLVVTLTGTGSDLNLRLWAPATVDPYTPKTVYDFSASGSSTERICYTASAKWGTGRYFIAVDASGSSAGSYTLKWNVSSRSDGNVPGVALTSNRLAGSVDTLWDLDDVHRIAVAAGGTLSATLTADVPSDALKLQLFDASTGGAVTSDIYAGSVLAQQTGPVACVASVIPDDGEYYLVVSAEESSDAAYTLDWSYEGTGVPGEFLGAWTEPENVAATRVYALDLAWGQTLRLSFESQDGGVVTAKLYAPKTFDLAGATPVFADTTVMAPASGTYTVPEGHDGIHYLVVGVQTPGTVLPRVSATTGARRLSGATRFETAVKSCASAFPTGADVVVIASGADFPDALAASGLAGAYGAPLLLTNRDSLPQATRNEIVRLGATRAFVIGAEAAISASVFNAVDALLPTTPVRLGGLDRYQTAAAVVRQVRLRRGLLDSVTPERIGFVARGDSFPDALALAPLAWQLGAPVYLVRPTALPAPTAQVLAEYAPDVALVAGLDAAVSPGVAAQVASYGPTVQRAGGANRYGTAVAVATWGVGRDIVSWEYAGVATGEAFPDALAGGVACGSARGLLLLTQPKSVPAEVGVAIDASGSGTQRVRVFGGTVAIAAPVLTTLDAYFR
jgi:putative cell wall-binding protein